MYFDELLQKMNPSDYELDCAVFEAVNFEVEEVFASGVAGFVVAWGQPILT